jgi:hypothetical protein
MVVRSRLKADQPCLLHPAAWVTTPQRGRYTPRATPSACCRSQLYRLIGRGLLDAPKIGRGTYITVESIRAILKRAPVRASALGMSAEDKFAVRFRLNLAGDRKNRTRWRKGDKPNLCGFWEIESFKKLGRGGAVGGADLVAAPDPGARLAWGRQLERGSRRPLARRCRGDLRRRRTRPGAVRLPCAGSRNPGSPGARGYSTCRPRPKTPRRSIWRSARSSAPPSWP